MTADVLAAFAGKDADTRLPCCQQSAHPLVRGLLAGQHRCERRHGRRPQCVERSSDGVTVALAVFERHFPRTIVCGSVIGMSQRVDIMLRPECRLAPADRPHRFSVARALALGRACPGPIGNTISACPCTASAAAPNTDCAPIASGACTRSWMAR